MDTFKISLLAFLAITTVALSSAAIHKNEKSPNPKKFNFQSLSGKDKMVLHLMSKIHPEAFRALPLHIFSEINEYAYISSIDNFFVDARQLFTQVMKIPETANHPELHWRERYDFCIWFFCVDFELSLSTGNTKFFGADTITTTTNFTPTSFRNTFHIPVFNWTSPQFNFNYTDYSYEGILAYQDTFVSFEQTTIIFQGDYKFVPDIGIQVENVAVYFDAGQVRWRINDIAEWDFQGNVQIRYDPIETDGDEAMIDSWTWAKREYVAGLEYSLNCFLSNGRSDPDGCVNDYEETNEYFKYLNMELIQTIGLGALLSP